MQRFIKAIQAITSFPEGMEEALIKKYANEIGPHFKEQIIKFVEDCGVKDEEYIILDEYYNGYLLIMEFVSEEIQNIVCSCDFAMIGDIK
jgi:hypothetical protein